MSQAAVDSSAGTTPGRASSGSSIVLTDIDWPTYSQLLALLAERRRVRLTYDRGDLEIMSPLLEHDDEARFLGDLVFLLTLELGLPLKRGGSVTLRRRKKGRGIEADESFWIANAPRMAGRRKLDLRKDPPPDLAIEADVTHSSMDRFSIYAALAVPEVWRLQGPALAFHILQPNGSYTPEPSSKAFPFVAPADILMFLEQVRSGVDENEVVRRFQDWIRQRRPLPPPQVP